VVVQVGILKWRTNFFFHDRVQNEEVAGIIMISGHPVDWSLVCSMLDMGVKFRTLMRSEALSARRYTGPCMWELGIKGYRKD